MTGRGITGRGMTGRGNTGRGMMGRGNTGCGNTGRCITGRGIISCTNIGSSYALDLDLLYFALSHPTPHDVPEHVVGSSRLDSISVGVGEGDLKSLGYDG